MQSYLGLSEFRLVLMEIYPDLAQIDFGPMKIDLGSAEIGFGLARICFDLKKICSHLVEICLDRVKMFPHPLEIADPVKNGLDLVRIP